MTVTLRGPGLTEDQVVAVARHGEQVALAGAARTKMERSRARVERAAASREPVYGVSTGFGALAGTRVAPLRQPELQLALIRSHAAGVGAPVDVEVVRATMLLRARTLAMGMSGVRPLLAEALIGMLNEGITPLVPRYGSVGCSGDLAPHPGQAASAANLTRLMSDSQIVASHRHSQHTVQDSYSVRCSPQVAGAARDTLDFVRRIAEVELSSTIDNPIVMENGDVESNGNFHGEPLAFAADFLAIAAAEVGSIAERRVDRLLDPHRSQGLPPFLAEEPGVNSGLMVAQYTAAALVAENRRLAAPASVDSIPTSGMQEDHVSMGWGAALKLRAVLDNLTHILAVELTAASRALDLRAPLKPAPATAAVRDLVRKHVGGPGPDRVLSPELAAAEALVRSGAVVEAAEAVIGRLR